MTTLEKLQAVPTRFWMNTVFIILSGVLAFVLVRHAAKINRYVLALMIVLLTTTIGFQWIYERNEPQVFTPFIDFIAPLFPQKPR